MTIKFPASLKREPRNLAVMQSRDIDCFDYSRNFPSEQAEVAAEEAVP
jgi:hypothetical protein